MKKRFALLPLLFFCLNAWCEDFTVDSIRYTIRNSYLTVTASENKANGYSGRVTIPEEVTYKGNKYKVTTIGSMAFKGCKGLTAVTIPASVTDIESRAFEGSGITNITLPVGLKSLGKCAFLNCRKLTNITLPAGVTKIEYGVFRNCTGLISIEMPPGIDTIDYLAFDSCYSLQAINIPVSVRYISPDAFLNCRALVTVNQANPVYSSLQGVLYNKRKTKLVFCPTSDSIYRIQATVCTIGEYAFWGKKTLKKIIIPPSVKTIEDYAFARSGLTSLKLPKSVTAVGPYSFAGCVDLKGLQIDSTIYHIDVIPDSLRAQETDSPPQTDGKIYSESGLVLPSVEGGTSLLYEYIIKNILYPTSIQDEGFEDKVILRIMVEKDGMTSEIQIMRLGTTVLAKEAIRIAKNIPPWKPGMAGNKPIKIKMFLPIVFKN